MQAVGYRAWTIANARALGLAGYVRNRSDGSVEAVFAGAGDVVDTMIARCRTGPPAAQVRDIEISSAAGEDAPMPFEARASF